MTTSITIDIPDGFEQSADAAVTRLRYLFPRWTIFLEPGIIHVETVESEDAAKAQLEVNYALYRERILAEGAPLRELLLKSVLT